MLGMVAGRTARAAKETDRVAKGGVAVKQVTSFHIQLNFQLHVGPSSARLQTDVTLINRAEYRLFYQLLDIPGSVDVSNLELCLF
jgi:hypothetical protein